VVAFASNMVVTIFTANRTNLNPPDPGRIPPGFALRRPLAGRPLDPLEASGFGVLTWLVLLVLVIPLPPLSAWLLPRIETLEWWVYMVLGVSGTPLVHEGVWVLGSISLDTQ